MIKFHSPAQLQMLTHVLAAHPIEYDGNTRLTQSNNGTVILSNREKCYEILTNGELKPNG